MGWVPEVESSLGSQPTSESATGVSSRAYSGAGKIDPSCIEGLDDICGLGILRAALGKLGTWEARWMLLGDSGCDWRRELKDLCPGERLTGLGRLDFLSGHSCE